MFLCADVGEQLLGDRQASSRATQQLLHSEVHLEFTTLRHTNWPWNDPHSHTDAQPRGFCLNEP